MIPPKLAQALVRLRFQDNGNPHQIFVDGDTHRTARHTRHYYACGRPAHINHQRIGASRDGLSDFTCLHCRDKANRERLDCYTAPTRIRIERSQYGLNFPEDMVFLTIKETLLTLSRHRNWLKHRTYVQYCVRRNPDLHEPLTTRESIMFWIRDEAHHMDRLRDDAQRIHECPTCHVPMTDGAIHKIECRYKPASWSNQPRKL